METNVSTVMPFACSIWKKKVLYFYKCIYDIILEEMWNLYVISTEQRYSTKVE